MVPAACSSGFLHEVGVLEQAEPGQGFAEEAAGVVASFSSCSDRFEAVAHPVDGEEHGGCAVVQDFEGVVRAACSEPDVVLERGDGVGFVGW